MRHSTFRTLWVATLAVGLLAPGCRRDKAPVPPPVAPPSAEAPTRPAKPVPAALSSEEFDALLREYAEAGKPPADVAQDPRFERYLTALRDADPDASKGDARTALLLNAHSALLIQCGGDSEAKVGPLSGRVWSLAELEREAMASTDAKEVVFALARADLTGPNLRPGAYFETSLAEQLTQDAGAFIRGVGAPRVDRQYAVLHLSPVFQAGANGPMEEDTVLWLVREHAQSSAVADLIDGGGFSIEYDPFGSAAPLVWAELPPRS